MTNAEIVNQWFAEKLACGAIARHTEAYNQAHEALPDLIARLDEPELALTTTNAEDPAAAAAAIPATPPAPATGKKG